MGEFSLKLFISPHSDDETLFGAFTLLREKPLVVVVSDSATIGEQRRAETRAAMAVLGCEVQFLGFSEREPWEGLAARLREFGQPEMVYAPCPEEGGHHHHNLVGEVASQAFDNLTLYMTYTKAGKSTGRPVPFAPIHPALKLRALACYESQIAEFSTQPHFLREQMEYYRP